VQATKRIDLRWCDFDVNGHVNNAAYLFFLEDTRGVWLARVLDDVGATMRFVVAHVAIDYRSAVERAVDHVLCDCELRHMGTSSVTTREVVRVPTGDVVAEAEVVLVASDPSTGRARPLSDAERNSFQVVERSSSS
jgi:acyl-CoA thioester hydrolase